MAKKRVFLLSLLIAALAFASAAPALPVAAMQPTPPVPETFQPVAENSAFQLYANPDTLAFKLVDKRSGTVWSSNLDEKADGDRLNKTWTAFAQSGISIDYLDIKAISQRNSITNAEHTIDYAATGQGFEATIHFAEPGISLLVRVTLNDSGVSVEVPFDSIKEENPDLKLGLVYVYPFMGATRADQTPGYMFIPDGPGSLIRFQAETKAKNMYYGRYYGDDLGMIAQLPFDFTTNRPFKVSIPVYGMAHQDTKSAYIAIVEQGMAYGEIQAHPAGVITNFNFIYNAFVYNQSYFQATNRSGAGVTTVQPNTNAFDIKINYRFLTGDGSDYVGMARDYQGYLLERGMLRQVIQPREDIGIRLEFLGGEKEKVLFWKRVIPMTTVAQMDAILADLQVKNPDVVYYGWQPQGASTVPPEKLKIDSTLGSKQDLRALADKVAAQGGRLYLYDDPQAAIYDEGGYSTRFDLAMAITNVNIIGYNRWMANYFMNLPALSRRLKTLSSDVAGELNGGLALDGIGATVYSDFKPANRLNREDAIGAYQALLGSDDAATAFYTPNDYVFGFMEAYYDMPLTSNGYIYTSEIVPFLQTVLAGYVPLYGEALNFSSNLREDLLRHADYGVYPSFFLTQEVTARILNTPSNWIYSSSYGQWGAEVKNTYAWLDGVLGPVTGQPVEKRELLAAGVSATTYANGMQVIVNYTEAAYQAGGVTVPARDAVTLEVKP